MANKFPYAIAVFVFFVFIFCSTALFSQTASDYYSTRDAFLQGFTTADEDTSEGSPFRDFRRWEWHWGQRLYPSGDFGVASQAINDYVQNFTSSPPALLSSSSNWAPLGPFIQPVSSSPNATGVGRLQCIAFHPSDNNKIYVGSPFGGVWFSQDGGQNWSNLNTDFQLPILRVSDIAINPVNPDIIYIATGDRDDYKFGVPTAGVYRSLDAGLTWTPVNNGLSALFSPSPNIAFHQIARILINGNNPDIIFLATSNGIYKTTDGTTSCNWAQITDPIVSGKYFRNIVYKPDNNYTTLYASGYDILKSVDGGSTWNSTTGAGTGLDYSTLTATIPACCICSPCTCSSAVIPVPFQTRINIDVTADNPDIVYAAVVSADDQPPLDWNDKRAEFIFKFDELSSTWTLKQTIDPGTTFYCSDINEGWVSIACSPINENEVYFGNVQIFRTLDGGNTRSLISSYNGDVHADVHELKMTPDGAKLFACVDGGLYISPGPNDVPFPVWVESSDGITVGTVYKLGLSATNSNFFTIGEQDNGSIKFDPFTSPLSPSQPWAQIRGGDGMEQAIDYTDENIFYSSSGKINIVRTSNRGTSYNSFICGSPPCATNNPPGTCGPENASFVAPYLIHPANHNSVLFGFTELWEGNFTPNFPSTPVSWQLLSDFKTGFGTDCGQYVNAIGISSANTNIIYVSTRSDGPEPPRLFKTIVGGCPSGCWSEIFPPNIHVIGGIAVHPLNPNKLWAVYSGYTAGEKVKVSDDGGATWIDYSTGLPNMPVNYIVYENGSNDGLYVATDVGIYYRNATMNSWQAFNNALPNVQVLDLEINYLTNKLVAATYGRGVWESSLACPQQSSLTLSGTQTTSSFEEADGLITSMQTILFTTNDQRNFYRSTDEISLLPGFTASATAINPDAEFRAFIHPCNSPGNSFYRVSDPPYEPMQELPAKSIANSQSAFNLYPNPNNGTMQLDYTLPDYNTAEFYIFDFTGRKILSRTLTSSQNSISISEPNLNNGIYFYQIVSAGKQIAKNKIIIIK